MLPEIPREIEKVSGVHAARGHQIQLLEPFSFAVGQGATVIRDSRRGVNFAAGDPRSDGAAIPQEPDAK